MSNKAHQALALCFGMSCLIAERSANGQAAVDWALLGADAPTIIGGGQTFTDIGATLGRPDLLGLDMTLSYTGTGVGGSFLRINDGSVASNQWNLFNGTLHITFSTPVTIRLHGGGSILAGEVDSFGPATFGSLISTHPQAGLVVTDDSVGNSTSSQIITSEMVWSSVSGTSFHHDVDVRNQGGTLFILPAPGVDGAIAARGVVRWAAVPPRAVHAVRPFGMMGHVRRLAILAVMLNGVGECLLWLVAPKSV